MKLLKHLMLCLAAIVLVACQDENVSADTTVNLHVALPAEFSALSLNDYKVEWVNTTTRKTTTASTNEKGIAMSVLKPGVYTLSVEGKSIDSGVEIIFQRTMNQVAVSGENMDMTVDLERSLTGKGWVIREIYYTGSLTESGKSYNQDQYIEIYNNSDELLYADGIAIAETAHLNSSPSASWTDFLPGQVAVQTVYAIPGSGKDHPVMPGKSILIAANGLNHKISNPNSPADLSKADFEWYDDHQMDTDVAEVPNLIKHFSYSQSIWLLHNRGYRGYVIFHPQEDMKTYMEKNMLTTLSASGNPTHRIGVKSELILDAVEGAQPQGPVLKALSSGLDKGYTYCDAANTAKSIRRKEITVDGKRKLQDTNNSTQDFIPNATPSPLR